VSRKETKRKKGVLPKKWKVMTDYKLKENIETGGFSQST
jgi:hypothetical protein